MIVSLNRELHFIIQCCAKYVKSAHILFVVHVYLKNNISFYAFILAVSIHHCYLYIISRKASIAQTMCNLVAKKRGVDKFNKKEPNLHQ